MTEKEHYRKLPTQKDLLRRLDLLGPRGEEFFHLGGQEVLLLLRVCNVQISDELRDRMSDPRLSRVYISGESLKRARRSRRLTGMAKGIAAQLSGLTDEGPVLRSFYYG